MITDIAIERINEENHRLILDNPAMIQLHDIMDNVELLSSANIHKIQETFEKIFKHKMESHPDNEDYKTAFNYMNDVFSFLNQNYTSASQFNHKIRPIVDKL